MGKLDLDQDVTINGHLFKAGKGVDTEVEEPDADGEMQTVDYSEAITDVMKSSNEGKEFAATHHGAVPTSKDPLEATAQTPTRPLGNGSREK